MEALAARKGGQVGLDSANVTAGSVTSWSKCSMAMALVSTGSSRRGWSVRPAWKRRWNGEWA